MPATSHIEEADLVLGAGQTAFVAAIHEGAKNPTASVFSLVDVDLFVLDGPKLVNAQPSGQTGPQYLGHEGMMGFYSGTQGDEASHGNENFFILGDTTRPLKITVGAHENGAATAYVAWGMPTTAEQWDGVAGDAKTLESSQIQQGIGGAVAAAYAGPGQTDLHDAMYALADIFARTVFQAPSADHPVTAGYVFDQNYLNQVGRDHTGIDFRAQLGDSVFSPTTGTVLRIMDDHPTNRNEAVFIQEDGSGRIWVVGHIDVHVKQGDHVTFGQTDLGTVKANADGTHAHFEVQDPGYSGGKDLHYPWGSEDTQADALASTISPFQAFHDDLFGLA